jgi:hypothetical protein
LKTNVLTFSKLAKWAALLREQDPDKYKKLKTGIPLRSFDDRKEADDWHVKMLMNHHFMKFTLKLAGGEVGRRKRDTNVTITGLTYKGKLYSRYEFQCSTTRYDKEFYERFMPISMPLGLNVHKVRASTTMRVRNADGTHSFSESWTNGNQGRSGYPRHHIVICDASGLVLAPSPASEVVDRADVHCSNGEATLEWFPKAVGYEVFMESISKINTIRPEWGAVVDAGKMQALANRTIHAALRFVDSVPGSKMKLFPAREASNPTSMFHDWNHGGDIGRIALLSFEGNFIDGVALKKYHITLPEVFVCWHRENNWAYSSLQIPPIGNKHLDFSNPESSGRFGTVLQRPWTMPWCCYQTVAAFDPDLCNPDELHCQNIHPGNPARREDLMFNFGKSDDHIMAITVDPRHHNWNYHRWMQVARRPEDALSGFLERALVDSLPLA